MAKPSGEYNSFPKTEKGTINKLALKKEYMDSTDMEWAAFCKAKGYNPKVSHAPVKAWQEEKAKVVMNDHRLVLREKILKHESKWHLEVLRTLEEYPELCNTTERVIKYYLTTINNLIVKQLKAEAEGTVIPEKEKFYRQFKPGDILNLANAVGTVVAAKHKSLMLDAWSIKLSQERSKDEDLANKAQAKDDNKMTFELMTVDGKKYSNEEMAKHLHSFYDAPWASEQAEDEKEIPKLEEP